MQISNTTSSYAGSEAQRLLAALVAQQSNANGQDLQGADDASRPSGPPPGPPPPGPPPGADRMASSQFSADTLSGLLESQTEQPSSADVASKLISDVDTDGDGTISLSEMQAALGSGDKTQDVGDALTQAMSKLDTDGDGKLSNAELSSALEAFKTAQGENRRPPPNEAGAA